MYINQVIQVQFLLVRIRDRLLKKLHNL